ncbi:hypothetical protein JWG39_13995 [Desulforhopalus vacuolatus]|nr:hypothetical protein [Desulforhopalus vacuolatus]MBM9520927.1 hypothetical protein [Desulforhopalus vacuolatus]
MNITLIQLFVTATLALLLNAGNAFAATSAVHSFTLLFNNNQQGQYLPCG